MVLYVENSDDESDDDSDEESEASAVETFSRSKEALKGPQKSAGASSSTSKPLSNVTQKSTPLQETKNGKAQSNGPSKSNKNTVPPVNEDSVPNDGSNITSKYLLYYFFIYFLMN